MLSSSKAVRHCSRDIFEDENWMANWCAFLPSRLETMLTLAGSTLTSAGHSHEGGRGRQAQPHPTCFDLLADGEELLQAIKLNLFVSILH